MFAERFRGVPGHPFERGFDLRLVPEKLEPPLHWKRPRKIFVDSMSDLFHDQVPTDFIAHVGDIMRRADWHVFQVLTKRDGRMRELLSGELRWMADLQNVAVEPTSFVVGHQQVPPTQLAPEDSVLFDQGGHGLLLPVVQPAGQNSEKQRRGREIDRGGSLHHRPIVEPQGPSAEWCDATACRSQSLMTAETERYCHVLDRSEIRDRSIDLAG